MLRKLFPHGVNTDGIIADKQPTLRSKDEWDEITGYRDAVVELDTFEARLRDLLRTLTRHCHTITEMCTSTGALYDQMTGIFHDSKDPKPARPECDEALGLVNMFRVSAIAPLQNVLITVPQLRIRCDHRRSALQLMLRYQSKVAELERSSKFKTESNRLQRNRAKLQSATTRFREMDAHVQSEIKALVSKDIAKIVGASVSELLVRAQRLVGEMAIDSAACFQRMDPPPQQQQQQEPHDDEAPEAERMKAGQPHEQPPQRRMAMIVVPDPTDSGVFVRQCILGPPLATPSGALSITASSRERRPSTTTTEDVEPDTQVDSDEEDDSGPEVHEDYGITKRKKHPQGTRAWDIHRQIKDNLSTDLDLAECVHLPEGYARDEWIAVHVVDFYNEINLLYGTILEFCTSESCPKMSAGPCYTYMWADTIAQLHQASPSTNLPAPMYVAKLMNWIEEQVNDLAIFPPDGATYDPDFEDQVAAVILKRLFRVYAHIYHNHLDHFAELSAESHLGFCFKRFVLFVNEFKLVDQKELNALRKLVQNILDEATLAC